MLPIPDNPDPDLIRQSREGDRDAYLQLVGRHALAVRAIVEARMPGDSRIDEECARAFERIHRTLFVVRELGWFHLFCVRSTQTHFDAKSAHGKAAAPPEMPWLRGLSIGQREALFFAERAEAKLAFPAIEYLGISQSAYDARVERGRLALNASSTKPAQLPEIAADFGERLLSRVDELLGPRPERREGLLAKLPQMPLALSFFLTVSVAALLTGLLFRPVQSRTTAVNGGSGEKIMHARTTSLDVPGLTLRLSENAIVERKSKRRIRLRQGEVEFVHNGSGTFEIELGGRLLQAGKGSYELSVKALHCRITTSNEEFQLFSLAEDGRIGPAIPAQTANEIRWTVDGKR